MTTYRKSARVKMGCRTNLRMLVPNGASWPPSQVIRSCMTSYVMSLSLTYSSARKIHGNHLLLLWRRLSARMYLQTGCPPLTLMPQPSTSWTCTSVV